MATREELMRNKDETLSLSARRYANNANNSSYIENDDDDLYDMGTTTGNSKGAKKDKDWAGSDSSKWNATTNTYGTLRDADKTVSSKDTTIKRSFDNADTFQRDRINKMIEQEEDDYGGYEDDEDEYAEDEIDVMDATDDVGRKPYQNPLLKPIIKVGGLEIGLSKAKLYGLVDSDGNVTLPGDKRDVTKVKNDARRYFNKISAPREINAEEIMEKFDEEKLTFKPLRNREADRAMRDPKCGYDFVDRLQAKGDFLDRAFGSSTGAKAEKKRMNEAEEAYKERIDKLRCPLCKREQSFQQLSTKQRECNVCGVRFAPPKVHSSADFEARMAGAEAKRAQRLKRLDDELYAPPPVAEHGAPKMSAKSAASARADSKATAAAAAGRADSKATAAAAAGRADSKATAAAAAGRADSKATAAAVLAKGSDLKRSQLEQQLLLLQLQRVSEGGSAAPPMEVLQQMARLQQDRASLVAKAVQEAERKYGSTATGRAAAGGSAHRPAEAAVKRSQLGQDKAPLVATAVKKSNPKGAPANPDPDPEMAGRGAVSGRHPDANPMEVLQQLARHNNDQAVRTNRAVSDLASKRGGVVTPAAAKSSSSSRGKGKGKDASARAPQSKFQDDDDGDEGDTYSEAFSSLLAD